MILIKTNNPGLVVHNVKTKSICTCIKREAKFIRLLKKSFILSHLTTTTAGNSQVEKLFYKKSIKGKVESLSS